MATGPVHQYVTVQPLHPLQQSWTIVGAAFAELTRVWGYSSWSGLAQRISRALVHFNTSVWNQIPIDVRASDVTLHERNHFVLCASSSAGETESASIMHACTR
jgi:hypothetical protein